MRILIIGSVAGGTSAAAKARRNNEENEIVIYDKDYDISYSGCGLPYYIGEDYISRENLTPRNPKWFKDRFNIDIFIGHEVMEIDSEKKELRIKDLINGNEIIDKYDKLIIATGAKIIKPSIDGLELADNIFYLRNVKNADTIKEFIETRKPKKAVIIGGGFIGLEMLENLEKLGIKTSLIEIKDQVMPSMDKDITIYLEDYLEKKGIELLLGETIIEISENGKKIRLESGKEIETDLILVSAGVRANIDLAREAGIKIGATDAIEVDKKMRTNMEDIYAVGDCAETYSLITGEKIYRPLGSTANKMGRIAGDVITGGDLEFQGILGTGIFKVFEMEIAQTGLSEKEARDLDYDIELIHNIKENQSKYIKESRQIVIKAIADKKTGRVLGAQIIGEKGVDKRIDVFATAITFKAKAKDLFHLDLAYSPMFSTTKDPVMYTGMVLENAMNRGRKIISISDLIKNKSEIIIIDVRSGKDYNKGHIEGAIHIPLKDLRERSNEIELGKKIAVHCNKGVTGNAAQNLLINLGFDEVYNISGGYKNYSMQVKI